MDLLADPRAARAPDLTRADIIETATKVFAERGLSGARVDEIADLTRTSKRMIYYYFKSKEGLYRAVLEDSYRRMRASEAAVGDLAEKSPMDSLAHHVGLTFDYQLAHLDFVRLVMVENIHRAEHMAQMSPGQIADMADISALRDIVSRGVAGGEMRPYLDPLDLHMSISALCFFNVANRNTFANIFHVDMAAPEVAARRRAVIIEMILRSVAP